MKEHEYSLELLKSRSNRDYNLKRNISLGVAGIVLGSIIYFSPVKIFIDEAKKNLENNNYVTSEQRIEEITEKSYKRFKIGGVIIKASMFSFIPGTIIPIARYRRRKKDLELELENN
jgi:hypothetical protein